jgi:hypothetical protein
MKHRSNNERIARKLRKAQKRKAKALAESKQIHVTHWRKPGYAEIMASVRSKTSHWVLRQAHRSRGITKLLLHPKLLWTNGTYNRANHGKLKPSDK